MICVHTGYWGDFRQLAPQRRDASRAGNDHPSSHSTSQKLIKAAVIDGLKRRHEIRPFKFETPITVDITYKDHGGAHNNIFFMPQDERIAGDKVRFVATNAKEAYYGFLARDKLSKNK